jgi:hypothetical protein
MIPVARGRPQQPMWRIGSQMRPSLMMKPCVVGLDAVGA